MDLLRNVGLLRSFLIVAREGNVTAAAEKLGISQPALTRNIRRLEEECGITLFDRHTRGVSLTVYGQALLRYAQMIETECRFASSELEALRSGHRGHLRIGGGPFWGGTLLPRALVTLHQRFPAVRTTLDVGVNTIVHPKLFAGELDLVVSASPHDLSTLPDHIGFFPLITIESGIFAREAHPVFAQAPLNINKLSEFQWVLYQADTDAIERLSAFLKSMGMGPPRIAIESSSLMAVVELVRAGDFLACLAAPLFGRFRDIGIRQIPTEREIWSFDAGILYHKAIETTAPFEVLKRTLLDLVTSIGLKAKDRQ
ncbi:MULTISPECIES: LysR family transcriptional regulator [unclassified Sinorhizobium]|uniref:LysR family transcriptional regulator n=1 Tax=unclassified Sinorhizobium TaxID=2613772 RepID=UPI0024C29939|nr:MULTISPECIES: LysR family transcriptional regulator [unclassified Sinorhizobium]MDK1374079.1 LysR family transcriptional regulator [Sinorhizobium sp. 6-70]MDK1480672.1 LysR family transcriptional regulator [Sinorhizobium sp. 6-117]